MKGFVYGDQTPFSFFIFFMWGWAEICEVQGQQTIAEQGWERSSGWTWATPTPIHPHTPDSLMTPEGLGVMVGGCWTTLPLQKISLWSDPYIENGPIWNAIHLIKPHAGSAHRDGVRLLQPGAALREVLYIVAQSTLLDFRCKSRNKTRLSLL